MNGKYILLNKILNDNTSEKKADELKNQLDKIKTEDADFDSIKKITDEIYALKGNDDDMKVLNDGMMKIKQNVKESKSRIPQIVLRTAAAAAVLLIGLNTYTVSAYNENIFSFAVQYTKKGVLVNFNQNEQKETDISLYSSADAPYGIRAKCEEVGMENVIVPTYLPDGFKLTDLETDNDDLMNYVSFTFENKNQLINLKFVLYHNEILNNIMIPSDEHNISEIEICGNKAIMSREDNQMIVMCQHGKYEFSIATRNVNYDECDRIINSYK